jgi:hypothetical protein
MKVQHRRLSFPLLVLTALLTLAPAISRAQLVPPGDFRGKSLAQWSFDWTEWGLKTGLGGQTLPDTVDGVRYLPPNLGSTFVTSLTIQQGTAVVFAPFVVFGENYDNGTSDNPADPVLNDIFADVTIQTMFDGATVLQGSGNAFPDRKYGPTSFAAPIVYIDPQPRGPGLNSVAAIFGLGIGAIFDPLPLGQHTIQNVYTSNFFGGTFSTTYNITVIPEPSTLCGLGISALCLLVARGRVRGVRPVGSYA